MLTSRPPASGSLAALVICASLAIGTGAWGQDGGAATDSVRVMSQPTPTEQLAKSVNTYRQHIFTLANPFMEGREPSTRGGRLAADYVEFHLNRIGLRPAFTDESTGQASWRQPFAVNGKDKREVTTESLFIGGVAQEAGKDFRTLGFSSGGTAEGPLSFVGYSIRRGENGYASYPDDEDLTGRIAVVLRFEPMKEDGTSKWADESWSTRATLDTKLRLAATRGAAGIILVSPPGAKDPRAGELGGLERGPQPLKVPVVMMSEAAADRMIRAADSEGRSLADLCAIANEKGGVIDLPKATAKIESDITRIPLMTNNVGGLLPGVGDMADELVVIGAHFDHVGYGLFGSMNNSVGQLHPGADDNASGTSAMLVSAQMVAEAIAKMPADAPRRSVLFLAFGAEESGLEGSAFYAKHPIRPAAKHYLMLNMDMVGRLRDGKLEVGGVGTGEGLEDWLDPYWEALGMKVKKSQVGPPNSDHFSFHQKQIPNIFFFTGFHPQYHRPADTADLINCEGAVQIADCCSRIALDAIARTIAMPFQKGEKPTPLTPNDDDDQQAQRPSRGNLKVRFGIAPGDYTGEVKGIMVGETIENLPAEKAGLKAGDLLTKWDGVELTDIRSWMAEMGKNKPGDKVKVTYIRDGKEATAEVTLVGS
ncbi:MAG: M28 family peptidase [Phycisphaerales bacterium]